MALSRYTFSKRLANGKAIEASKCSYLIFRALEQGALKYTTHILQEGERLDQLAGTFYGDGRLWWIIASASGIGWVPQVPPGTILRVPTEPSQVFSVLI